MRLGLCNCAGLGQSNRGDLCWHAAQPRPKDPFPSQRRCFSLAIGGLGLGAHAEDTRSCVCFVPSLLASVKVGGQV